MNTRYYLQVTCPFCKARPFSYCVKVRGPERGHPANQPHAVRGYAFFRAVGKPLRL